MLARIWSPLSSDLSEFNKRVDFEKEIFAEAKSIAAIISDRKIKESPVKNSEMLDRSG